MVSHNRCLECGLPLDAGDLCTQCDQEARTVPPQFSTDDTTSGHAATPTVDSRSPLHGTRFGDYELLEEIARGGMGVVYKARHLKLNRITALKMILGGRFSSADELQRFHIEAEAAARLDHPGIVPVYDIGEQDGQPFFAMKYIEGGSLAERMNDLRSDPKLAIRMLASVAQSVHHAHQRGILHRDLKPANILLDEFNSPLLTDLGLAKSTADDSRLTKTGTVMGTPGYMSPEQAAAEHTVTTAADVYSLGAIMYELLTGRPPHCGATALDTLMSILNDIPAEPRKLNPHADAELELICMKCIERDPEARYPSAAMFAADLESWLAGEPISLKPPSLSLVARRWMKHNRRAAYVIFAILMSLAFAVPVLAAFLGGSSDAGDVYRHFPDGERPLIFAFGDLPPWISTLGMLGMVLLVWPSIGLWNAVLTHPQSMRQAIGSGSVTALVWAFLIVAVFGWLYVAALTGDYSADQITVLAQAVWTPENVSPESAMQAAEDMYEGLDAIDINQRAEILGKRLFHEQVAMGPHAVWQIVLVSFLIATPIIYGTVITYILMDRKLHFWIVCLRYALAWASVTAVGVLLLGYSIGAWTGTLVLDNLNAHVVIIAAACATFVLAMCRWKRPTAEAALALGGRSRPPTPVSD